MRLLVVLLGLLLLVHANKVKYQFTNSLPKVSITFKILAALNTGISSDVAAQTLRQKLTSSTLNSPYQVVQLFIYFKLN